jgi:hypothetical protein
MNHLLCTINKINKKRSYVFLLLSVFLISFIAVQVKPQDGYEKYKNTADSIFKANQQTSNFSFQRVYNDNGMEQARVALMIGSVFNDNQKNAVVFYSTSDTSMDLHLFELKSGKWNLQQTQSMRINQIGAMDEFVNFEDLNGDGVKELIILRFISELHSEESVQVLFLKEKKLLVVKGFENYSRPEYDSKTNTIFFYAASACTGDMFFEQGVMESDSLKIINTINCNCCLENQDSCMITINR